MHRDRWVRWLKVLTWCTAIGIACTPGDRPPAAPSRGTLSVGAERTGAADTAPFGVVFAAPQGEATSASELSVVFNRPLRALETAEDPPPPPVTIDPPITGKWHWVGSKGLRFVPDAQRLPAASRYVVEVSADTRALDGSTLSRPYRFEFKTPRPKVVRQDPYDGAEGLPLDQKITLEFNQPVDPAVFEKTATLSALAARKAPVAIPFTARHPEPNLEKALVLTPKAKLPKDTAIQLRISERFVGKEGPLPVDRPIALSYKTYGPLRVQDVDCDTNTPNAVCAPGGVLGISVSNAVKQRELARALSVTPEVSIKVAAGWAEIGGDEPVRHLGVVGAFEPGKTYQLTIAKGLVDEFGQALAADHTQTVRIDDYFPYAELGVSGDTLPASQVRPLEIGSVNVPSFELFTASLAPRDLGAFLDHEDEDVKISRLSALKHAKSRTVKPPPGKNRMAKEPIALEGALGKPRGVLAMGIRYARDPKDYRRPRTFHLLKVTDLAVSAKLSQHGSVVWVTRLDSGAPVGGAEVQFHVDGKPAGRAYTTDANGIAKIPADASFPGFKEERPATVVVSKDDDWTYESFAAYLSPWRLPVPMDVDGTQREYGLLFTERGVYRPGDTVRVKAILRNETPTGNAIPAGQKLSLVLASPDGEKMTETKVTVSRYGTITADLAVPAAGPVGQWQAYVDAGKDRDRVASEYFEVAEYRPAEFKVTADSNAPSYVRGGTASFSIRGDYLFGAPMPNAATRYSVTRGPAAYTVPGTEGFVTDASAYHADLTDSSLPAGSLGSADAVLDASGALGVKQALPMPGQRGAEVVRLDAEVTDVSRQSIGASASAIVHPADFYVGLAAPNDYFLPAPGDVPAKVIAVAPDGKRVAGKKVTVTLVHRKWTHAREATRGGESRYVTKVVDSVASTCEAVTAAAPVTCTLRANDTGYYVARADAKDARGNPTSAAFGFYATGSAAGASFADGGDEATVGLVTNKKQYAVGDTARVLVKSPFAEAEALVTVERAGVYRQERVTLKGPAPTISVAVTDDLRPNAFVSVHLLRSTKVKGVGPLYRAGYAELKVDPEARRLSVEVKPDKKEYRPGEEVRVDLAVKGAGNQPSPAELTVYAVDEGVLMLTGYRTPDPLPVFTASRPLNVATLETRDSMAKITLADFVMAVGGDKGDEGGGGGDSAARQDFKATAFFDPNVACDANGRATVRFKLPDNLTTFRVMAVAAAETDQYGFGSASIVSSKKLMARPNLPRFLRSGDRAEAGIVLSSKGLPKAPIKVRASASGVALEGEAERTVELPEKGSVEVRFPFVAGAAGPSKFRFDVAGGGEVDAVEVSRAVQAPSKLQTVALYGATTGSSSEAMGDYSAVRKDVGSLEVSLSSSALVGLDGSAASLVRYPYECTEQLSSRLLPLVPLRELAERFGFDMPKDARAVIGDTVRDVMSRQRSDGGFAMWPESPRADPFVSAYATWALHQAKARGQTLPKSVLDRAHQYLRKALAAGGGDAASLATGAMIVDVLATTGAPDPGYMGRLFEARKTLPPFARAFLLHALVAGKGPAASVKELAAELSSELRIAGDSAFAAENVGDEYAVLLDSQARTTALVLRALLAADPDHALIAPLARGLLALRRDGTWRSTQETAYALVALDAYWRAREKQPASFSAKVWLGGAPLFEAELDSKLSVRQATVALARLPDRGGALVFQKEGSGTLFYEARLHYARKALPKTPLDAGFFVQKALRGVAPESLPKAIATVASSGQTEFRAGDLVLTDLVVVTPSPRDYVVLDDPLPAGFEAVDTGFATTAAWLDVPGSTVTSGCEDCAHGESERDARAHGRGFGWSWFRRETRDDRVVFFVDHMPAGMYHYRYLARATTHGSFVLPPTQAEEMYAPETFGRTGAASIVVK